MNLNKNNDRSNEWKFADGLHVGNQPTGKIVHGWVRKQPADTGPPPWGVGAGSGAKR